MAIIINDNYSLQRQNQAFDARYLDGTTPWVNVGAAEAGIPTYRYTGLTVNILGEEYWWKDGVGNGDLIPKTLGGSSNLTGATNGLSLFSGDSHIGLGGNLITGTTISANTNTFSINGVSGTSFSISDNGGTGSIIGSVANSADGLVAITSLGTITAASASTAIISTQSNGHLATISNTSSSISSSVSLSVSFSGDSAEIYVDETAMRINDNFNNRGLENGGDYEDNFVARSLVTKQYVTGVTSGITGAFTTANNGLSSLSSQVVSLGGDLTGTTTISMSGVTSLIFTDTRTTTSGVTYGGDYEDDFVARSLVTKQYVTGHTQCISNTIDVCNVYAPYTATTENDFVGVSGTTEVWLPNPRKAGQRITVADICGNALSVNICIVGNGLCINGDDCALINTNYGSMTFINNNISGWSAVAFIN